MPLTRSTERNLLKKNGYRPRQVQDFIPAPMDVATCMYWTGLDPMTMKPVESARRLRDREVQRALLQFFKPENYASVRDTLRKAGREDLIGDGPDCLIPSHAPRLPRRTGGSGKPGGGGSGDSSGGGSGGGSAGYRRASRERGRGRNQAR